MYIYSTYICMYIYTHFSYTCGVRSSQRKSLERKLHKRQNTFEKKWLV